MRNTLILLLLALALGAWVYFYEIKGGEKRAGEKAIEEKIFDLEVDSIQTVRINNVFDDFEFRKTTSGWQMTKPLETAADKNNLEQLLNSLRAAKKERSFTVAADNLRDFGLAETALRLQLETAGGTIRNLLIGDKASIGSSVYLSTGDTMVAMVEQSLKTAARKSLFEWRDKTILKFDRERLQEIKLDNRHGALRLAHENNNWRITSPQAADADDDVVNALLTRLENNTVKAYVRETVGELNTFGLDKPSIRLEMFSGEEKARTSLSTGKLNGADVFAMDEARPVIFTIDTALFNDLDQTFFQFREKSVLNFPTERITSLSLDFENLHIKLAKDTSGTWFTGDSAEARSWKVSGILSALRMLEARRFIDETPLRPEKYGFNRPSGRVQAGDSQSVQIDIEFGNRLDTEIYLFERINNRMVTISAEKLKDIFPGLDEILEEKRTDN